MSTFMKDSVVTDVNTQPLITTVMGELLSRPQIYSLNQKLSASRSQLGKPEQARL